MAHCKLWLSAYQPLKRKCMAPGLPHPACQSWKGRSTLGPKTPGWPRITVKCERKKPSCWPSYSNDVPFGPELPQTYSVEPYKSCYECLVLVVEEGDWFNMEKEIWEGVRKDPMVATALTGAPTLEKAPSPKRVPPQMARAEELTCSTSPDPPSVPKLEGAAPPQDLALVPSRQPPPPQVFSPGPEDLGMPPLEDAYLPGAMTLFDLSTLELLEMTISHTPAMGKVHYCLQAWSLTRISLLSTSSQRHLEPSPKVEEPCAIIMLHYIMGTPVSNIDSKCKYPLSNKVNLELSEYPLSWWSEF